jgi:transposase
MEAVNIPSRRGPARRRPRRLAADKAYSIAWIRRWLRDHRIQAVVPTRTDQPRRRTFDVAAYRARNAVERCIGWLKEARRVGTRYEKLASSFLGMVRVATILRLLGALLLLRSGQPCPTR